MGKTTLNIFILRPQFEHILCRGGLYRHIRNGHQEHPDSG